MKASNKTRISQISQNPFKTLITDSYSSVNHLLMIVMT